MAKKAAPAAPHCSMPTLLAYLTVVVVSVICTRLLDNRLLRCYSEHENGDGKPISVRNAVGYKNFGSFEDVFGPGLRWPEQGYGTQLSLKIYVYEDWEIDGLKELLRGRDHNIDPNDCVKGQWGTQVKIHQLLLQSRFRVMSKHEAQFFFVPTYVKCVRMKGGLTDKEINQKYIQIIKQMPYFRRSGGRDHIFVFPSGAGAHLFKDWVTHLNRSIFLTPEGDRTDKRNTSAFDTWKDIIIPGNIDNGIPLKGSEIDDVIRPLPLSKRRHLANYLGRAQGKLGRLQLLELAKEFPDELEAPALSFSGSAKLQRKEYFEHLKNAKFCLAPRGESSWTLRFYESFLLYVEIPEKWSRECVPVILSDHIELPFQNVLDYRGFSIKWPSSQINRNLLQYLKSIKDEDIERMIARGRAVRCLWIYAPELGCTAFTGILWELQRKVRQFHQSSETFWLHNMSIINQDFLTMDQWHGRL